MQVVVTGAGGFIGRHLVQDLLDNRDGEIFLVVRAGSQARVDALIRGDVGRDIFGVMERRDVVPLAGIVAGAVEIMTPEAKRNNVRLLVELPAGLPEVRADPILIEQVLVNLIRNGIEAMSRTKPAARQIRLQASRQDERYVAVSVIDRGRGLSPEEREQIFTSFFTTKPDGLGMGLKICRSIVEFHEGRLTVDDNPLGGTEFRFTLPVEA